MTTDQQKLEKKLQVYLEKCLKNSVIKKFHVEIGDRVTGGSLADTFFLKVIEDSDRGKTLDLVVKKSKNVTGSFKTDMQNACKYEGHFYSKALPVFLKFNKEKTGKDFTNIPLCYGSVSNEEEELVFLEDLRVKNYKLNELKNPMTLDYLKLVLRSYAEWHAITMSFYDQNPAEFQDLSKGIKNFVGGELETSVYSSVKKGLIRKSNFYQEKQNSLFADRLRKTAENFDDNLQKYNECKGPLVWRHGDSWNNNHMFHYKDESGIPDHHKLLDWQISGPGSPLNDLVVFLYGCSSKKELEHFDDLLQFYYEIFSKKITDLGSDPVKLFPFEVLRQEWKKCAFVGLGMMPLFWKVRFQKTPLDYEMETLDNKKNDDIFHYDVEEGPWFDEVHGMLEHAINYNFL